MSVAVITTKLALAAAGHLAGAPGFIALLVWLVGGVCVACFNVRGNT